MKKDKSTKDLICTNKFCYVHKVVQTMDKEREETCHNCGFALKPWKPYKDGESNN